LLEKKNELNNTTPLSIKQISIKESQERDSSSNSDKEIDQ
jgi:hypothetical protein